MAVCVHSECEVTRGSLQGRQEGRPVAGGGERTRITPTPDGFPSPSASSAAAATPLPSSLPCRCGKYLGKYGCSPVCCAQQNEAKQNKTKAKEIEPLSVLSLSWQVRARVLFRVPASMSAMIDVARSICQADQTKNNLSFCAPRWFEFVLSLGK